MEARETHLLDKRLAKLFIKVDIAENPIASTRGFACSPIEPAGRSILVIDNLSPELRNLTSLSGG